MKYGVNDGGFGQSVLRAEQARIKAEKKERHASKLTGAHTTMPIQDMRMVNRWLQTAKEHDAKMPRGGVSWYMLVLLGFNTSLRISDLTKLKVKDVRGRERVRIIADKTGKMTDIKLQQAARNALDTLLKNRDEDEYILTSRQKGRKDGRAKPISRQRAYAIISEIARKTGFEEHVGCHTMRKTFAWNFYQASGDLAKLQKVLNHSSQEATIHYLGLDQKAIDETIDEMQTMV